MRRQRRAVATAVVLLLVMAACGDATSSTPEASQADASTDEQPSPDAEVRDTLAVHVASAPVHLDLTRPTMLVQPLMLFDNVYQPLVRVNDQLEIEPLLAESYDVSDDGTAYTFHLREATFHDGSEFDADDVLYTFEHNMDDEDAGSYIEAAYAPIESVEKTDQRTVVVTLTEANNRFLSPSTGLASSAGVIIPEGAASEDLQTQPVGTGPFQVTGYAPEESLTVSRFEDYWGDAAPLREVVFRFIDDPNSAVTALQAGDIDAIATLLAPERAGELENAFNVVNVSGGPIWHLVMNVGHKALADERVRQAMVHAIDQQAFIDGVQFGFAEPACGWIPVTHAAYDDPCTYAYDPDQARTLLADAGAEGLSLTIRAIQVVEPAAQLVAAQLRDVGIQVEVERLDDTAYFDEFFAGNFELTVIGYDESAFFDIADCPPPWYNGYCNEEVSELRGQGDHAATLDEAISLWADANALVAEEAISAELFNQGIPMILPPDLTGYKEVRLSGEFDISELAFGQ